MFTVHSPGKYPFTIHCCYTHSFLPYTDGTTPLATFILHSPNKHPLCYTLLVSYHLLLLSYTQLVNTPLPYTSITCYYTPSFFCHSLLSYPFLILSYTGGTTPLPTFATLPYKTPLCYTLLVSYPFLILPYTQVVNTLLGVFITTSLKSAFDCCFFFISP